MTRKTNTRPNPKNYPGKSDLVVNVKRNVVTVTHGDLVAGIFSLVRDLGVVLCGCKRCRDGKTAETDVGYTTHDLLVESTGVKNADLTVGHVGDGLRTWKREISKIYPSIKTLDEFKALSLKSAEPAKRS